MSKELDSLCWVRNLKSVCLRLKTQWIILIFIICITVIEVFISDVCNVMMLYVISADPEPASLWAATFKPKFVETKANLSISLRQKSHTEWNYVLDIKWVCDSVAGLCASSVKAKAGRLVGLADCYAVIVLADNATLLLADRPNNRGIISHCCSTNRSSASEFWGFGFRS